MPPKDSKEEKKEKAREVVDILEEISFLLVSVSHVIHVTRLGNTYLNPDHRAEYPTRSTTIITLRFTH